MRIMMDRQCLKNSKNYLYLNQAQDQDQDQNQNEENYQYKKDEINIYKINYFENIIKFKIFKEIVYYPKDCIFIFIYFLRTKSI